MINQLSTNICSRTVFLLSKTASFKYFSRHTLDLYPSVKDRIFSHVMHLDESRASEKFHGYYSSRLFPSFRWKNHQSKFQVTYCEDLFQNQFHKRDNLSQIFVNSILPPQKKKKNCTPTTSFRIMYLHHFQKR